MTRLDQTAARLRLARRTNDRLRRERDEERALVDTLAAERDEALRAMDRIAHRLAEVEAERDRMYEDGQAAALAVAQLRRLASNSAEHGNGLLTATSVLAVLDNDLPDGEPL